MKRFIKILSFVLLFIFTISFARQNLLIKVNNKYIESDVDPFIKNGTTYVPIKFVASALGIENVSWNARNKAVTIKENDTTILLIANQKYAYVNNVYTALENSILISNGRTFVPLRFVSEWLNRDVSWDSKTSTVSINEKTPSTTNKPSSSVSSTKPSTKPSNSTSSSNTSSSTKPNNSISSNNASTNTTYTEDEVYWLSRIIEAEAGGEPFRGKVAVGEVILNRVESDEFPDTIWGVIFDDEFGVQFEPVSNGTIYNTPSNESIKAAKTALSGSNYIGDCLYFLNPTIASSNWITKNREFYTTINNHDFYA